MKNPKKCPISPVCFGNELKLVLRTCRIFLDFWAQKHRGCPAENFAHSPQKSRKKLFFAFQSVLGTFRAFKPLFWILRFFDFFGFFEQNFRFLKKFSLLKKFRKIENFRKNPKVRRTSFSSFLLQEHENLSTFGFFRRFWARARNFPLATPDVFVPISSPKHPLSNAPNERSQINSYGELWHFLFSKNFRKTKKCSQRPN